MPPRGADIRQLPGFRWDRIKVIGGGLDRATSSIINPGGRGADRLVGRDRFAPLGVCLASDPERHGVGAPVPDELARTTGHTLASPDPVWWRVVARRRNGCKRTPRLDKVWPLSGSFWCFCSLWCWLRPSSADRVGKQYGDVCSFAADRGDDCCWRRHGGRRYFSGDCDGSELRFHAAGRYATELSRLRDWSRVCRGHGTSRSSYELPLDCPRIICGTGSASAAT